MMLSLRDLEENTAVIRYFKLFLGFFVPAAFFVYLLRFSGLAEVFQNDPDEGMCLMRAFLHSRGHALYQEVWIDHPPFLFLMLSGVFKIFGPSVFHARVLILMFSSLLAGALFQIISKTQNVLTALLTVVLLALIPKYLFLSSTVIIGLPAISLAILSCYGVFLYRQSRRKIFLLLSGCLIALALQTKFFVIVFVPALIYEIIIIERGKCGRDRLVIRMVHVVSFWLMALVSVYLFVAFVWTSIDFSQLIGLHVVAKGAEMRGFFDGFLPVKKWILENMGVALLALGSLFWLRQREAMFLRVPLVSFLLAVFAIGTHAPVWYHHSLLVLVPMFWLASFGLYKLFSGATWCGWRSKGLFAKTRDILAIFLLIPACALTVARLPARIAFLSKRMKPHPVSAQGPHHEVVELMKQYGGRTHLVVTDAPIFPFYAGLPCHPYLTTISEKRFKSGFLTIDDFLDVIREERPEMVFLARYDELREYLVPHLEGAYELKFEAEEGAMRLYILKEGMRDKKESPGVS